MSSRNNRRLIWSAFFLLIALNLVVGALAYRYLARIDANYTKLLEQGVPFLNQMQTATAQASRSYGLLVDMSQAETDEELAKLEQDLYNTRSVSDQIFASTVYQAAVPETLRADFDDIRKTRAVGRERLETYFGLLQKHNKTEAEAFLRHEIYPSHKAYLTKLDRFCDLYQDSLIALNRRFTNDNAQTRNFLFGVSAVPFVVLLGLMVVVVVAVLIPLALLSRSGSELDQ